MYCKNCGQQIDDNAVVCVHCGVGVRKVQEDTSNTNTIAIIGFILSFFITIAGLICSIIGLKKANECDGKGKGFAIAGIAISLASMVLGFIYFIFFFAMFAAAI